VDLSLQAQQLSHGRDEFENNLLKQWQTFTKSKDISRPSTTEKKVLAKCEKVEAKSNRTLEHATWQWQAYVLLQREFFKQASAMINAREIAQTILISVLIGLAFLQMPREATRVRDMMNAIYLVTFYIICFYPIFKWTFVCIAPLC
jgi:hypothetical protein